MNTHKCINSKCENSYQSEDLEAYYCSTCIAEVKRVAAEVDAKRASQPREAHKSDLQIALEKGRRNGSALFVRAGDLGISFNG